MVALWVILERVHHKNIKHNTLLVMKNFYFQLSLFLFCLLMSTSLGATNAIYSEDVKTPVKDKTKTENLAPKDKKEGRDRNDRPKKEDVPLNTTKPKKKNVVVATPVLTTPLKQEEERTLPVDLPMLTNKNVQLLSTNLGLQKNLGPDPFTFTIITSKDSVSINEEFEVSIKVNWVDFGVNTGVRFLPEWYKYTLKVLMPKGFLQTGGDYTDYCTKPVDAQNPEAIFTIKGKFEYQPADAKFTVLRGFEGSNDLSGFVWKGEKEVFFLNQNSYSHYCNVFDELRNSNIILQKSSRINESLTLTDCQDIPTTSVSNTYKKDNGNCINVNNTNSDSNKFGLDVKFDSYLCENSVFYALYRARVKNISKTNIQNLVILLHGAVSDYSCYMIGNTKNAHYNSNDGGALSIGNCIDLDIKVPILDFLTKSSGNKLHAHILYNNTNGDEFNLDLPSTFTLPPLEFTPTAYVNNKTLTATGCSGTITWNNNAGTGSSVIVNPTVTTTYNAKCTVNGCDSDWSNDVTVTVAVGCTLNLLDPETTDTDCGLSTGVIYASVSGGTPPYQFKIGTGTYLNNTDGEFRNLGAGNYDLYVLDSKVCEKSINVTINSKNGPNDPTDYAGGSCEGGCSINLTAKCSTGSTITWYTVATGGTSAGTGSPFPTGSISTTTDYYVACRDANNCESGRKKVTATINPITNVCEGTNTPSKPSGSNNSRFGTGTVTIHASCTGSVTRWYDSNNVLKQEGNLPQDDFFITPIINAEANDVSVTYYASCLRRIGTTECESDRIGVTATVKPITDPCANTTPASPSKNDNRRDGAGPVMLTATCSNSKTQWYDASVGGNVKKTASDSNDKTYITDFLTETTTFYAACVGDNECKSDRVSVTATIDIVSPCANSRPAAPTTTDDSREGAGGVTVTASCPSGSTAKWYATNSSTTELWSGNNYSTSIVRTTTFYASCHNDECASNRVPATATINDISNPCAGNAPPAPSPTNGSREGTGSVSIYASCAGNTTRWYASASGGSPLKTAGSSQDDQFNTPDISATTIFYAVCLNASACESGRVGVVATVLPPCSTKPKAPQTSPGERTAAGSVNVYANCQHSGQNWTNITAKLYDGSNRLITTSTQDQLTVNVNETSTFYATCYNNVTNCESDRSPVVATVNPCNTPTPSPTNGSRCGAGSIDLWAGCSGNDGRWYNSATGGNHIIQNSNDNNRLVVTVSSSRLYYASCINTSNGCESQRVGVWAVVIPATISTTTDVEVCEGSPINLQVTNTESFAFTGFAQPLSKTSTYQWTGPNGFVSNSQTPNIPAATLANAGNYTAKVLNQYSHFLLNNGGPLCTATTVAQVSVYPTPATAPTLTASPVCQGKEVTITATNCISPNVVLWYNSTNATTPIGNGLTFDVTVPTTAASAKYYAACTSNPQLACNSAKAEITITPIPAPAAPTNARVNKPNTCIGSSVTLSASCPTGQTTVWYTSNTSNATSFSTLTFNLPAAGTYKYYAACQAGACETLPDNRAEVSVTVNPYPAAPTATSASATTIACNSETPLTFNGTCGNGQKLRWYSDLGGIVTNEPGVYDYYLACQDITSQCATPVANRVKNTITITKPPLTVAPAFEACYGNSLTLTATGANNVEWSGPNGFLTNVVSPTIGVALPEYNNGIYTVTTKYMGNCSATATTLVTVQQPIKLTSPKTYINVCQGGTINLDVLGASTYAWTGLNSYNSVLQNNIITNATVAHSGTYEVIGTTGNCSEALRITVQVTPAPTNTPTLGLLTSATTTSTTVYPKQIVSLEAKVCPDCYVEWYEKTNNDDWKFVPDLGAKIWEIQKNVAGTYQYKFIQKSGVCDNNNYSNTFTINVVNCADIAIEQPSPQYICKNGVVTLSVSTTKRGDNTNFKWFEQVSDSKGGIIEIPTNVTTDFYQVSYGQYVVKSCPVNGIYYGQSNPVVVKGMEVNARILVDNTTVSAGSAVQLQGADESVPVLNQNIVYSWATPGGVVNNVTGGSINNVNIVEDGAVVAINNFQQENVGKYTLIASKTIGSTTCVDESDVEIVINPAGCTIDFNGDPVATCVDYKGTITINTKDALAGGGISYRVNCGPWQSSNVFNNLTDDRYLVEIKQTTASGDQGGLSCRAKSGGRSVIVKCGPIVDGGGNQDDGKNDVCKSLDVDATPSSFNLEFPVPVRLTAVCNGKLKWRKPGTTNEYFMDANGDYETSPTVQPVATTDYVAHCIPNGVKNQVCLEAVTVTVNSVACENFKFQHKNQLIIDPNKQGAEILVKGCDDENILWFYGDGKPLLSHLGKSFNGLRSITVYPKENTTYKAVCDTKVPKTGTNLPNNCSITTEVKVETDENKQDCARYYKNVRIKRSGSYNLTLATNEQRTSISINPGDILEISDIENVVDIITQGARNEYILEKNGTRIAHKDDPCYVFSASEVFNRYTFDGTNESSEERIPKSGSCRGAKFDFHFPKIDKNTKLETFAINKGSWGTSFGSNECSKIIDVKIIDKVPAGLNCDNFKAITSKNLVSIGEAVTLSVIGANASLGDITWVDKNGSIGSGKSITVNPYLTKNEYTVTGGVEKDDVTIGCTAKVEVEVLPLKPLQCEDFKLSASSTLVGDGYDPSTTLTVKGCEGGVLKWIGGANTTYTVTPTTQTTYQATCYLGEAEGEKPNTQEVTINVSKFEVKASPEIVGYYPNQYVEQPNTTLIATGCNADVKGTLRWIGGVVGTSDRILTQPNKTVPTTTYFARCNYANGKYVDKSVTVRYIQRYVDCTFLVNSDISTDISIKVTNCQGTIFAIPAQGEDTKIYPVKQATGSWTSPAKLEFKVPGTRSILYKFICSTTGCISSKFWEFRVNNVAYQRIIVPQKDKPIEDCKGYTPTGKTNTYNIPSPSLYNGPSAVSGASANNQNYTDDYSQKVFAQQYLHTPDLIEIVDGACMVNNGTSTWYTNSGRTYVAGYPNPTGSTYIIKTPSFSAAPITFYGKCVYPNGDFCNTELKIITPPKNLGGGRIGTIVETGTLAVVNTTAADPCPKGFNTRKELIPIIHVILKRLLDGIGCSALTLDDAKKILNKLKEQFETNTTLQKYTLNFTNIDAMAQLLMNDCSSGTRKAAEELVKGINVNATITPTEQKKVLAEIANVIQKIEVVTAFTYLDPTGYPFSVKLTDNDFRSAKFLYSKNDWNKNYPNYTLYGFSINGEEYKADIVNGNFRGYKTASGKQLIDSKDYTGTKQVRLIHYDGLCKMYSIIYSYQVKPKRATVATQAELLITLTGNEGFTKWNMADCVDILLEPNKDPQKSNYPLLSIEQRKNFIKRRCPSSIATQINNIEEHNIIRVIETTQDNQVEEMYNWLNGTITGDDGRPYLACLFDHIDDAILFGPKRDDNYKNLNLALANLAFRHKPYQDKAANIFNNTLKNRNIPYTYRSIWQRMFTDPAVNEPAWNFSMNNAGIVSIGGKIVTGYEVTNYDKSTVRRPNEIPIPSQTLNPLEPVLLINRSNLLSISDIGDQNGGNIVPAAMLIYVDDKARNKTILDAVDAAANIAGVVTGGIAIKAGITGITRGFAIADIANSSANLGVNYFNATINGGNTNPKLQAVLNTWNAVNGIFGIVRTVGSLDDAIDMAINTRNTRLLSNHVDDFATNIIKADGELTLLSQQELAAQYVAIERLETEIELSETLANDAVLVDKLRRAKELVRYDFELLTYFKSLGLAEQYYHRAAQLTKSSVIDDFAKLLVKSGTPLTDSKQFVGEIIKGQVAAKTLDNLSIKNFDAVADDIEFVIRNHGTGANTKPDIKKYFNEMLAQEEKFKAGTVGLEIIRKNPPPSYLVGARIEGFEQTFTRSANRYDLLFMKGDKKIFIDTKNYSSTSGIFDGADNLKQIKAYFKEIENIDELFYVIQSRSGFPADPILSLKKQLSDKVFNFDGNYGFYDEIDNANPLIFPSMNILSKTQFEAAVAKNASGNLVNPNHPIFNILKIND
jgi:Ig-like domain CHU_C associated